MMKARVFLCVALVVSLLVGCGPSAGKTNTGQPELIRIVATVTPHAEVLEYIKPDLIARGVEIQIIDAPDYNMPNRALAANEADANYFQHVPYLTRQIEDFGYEIESLVGVHIEPMGFYSRRASSLDELGDGAVISIPNDPSNGARALVLLHNNGLIELDDPTNVQLSVLNIVSNPKNIRFHEIDAAMLSRTLEDVDGSVINSNFAMEAGFVPTRDAIVMESPYNNPNVNLVAVRIGDAELPKFQILKEVITSDRVRQFLLDRYEGAVVPAF